MGERKQVLQVRGIRELVLGDDLALGYNLHVFAQYALQGGHPHIVVRALARTLVMHRTRMLHDLMATLHVRRRGLLHDLMRFRRLQGTSRGRHRCGD